MSKKTENIMPSVLSFERRINVSDGVFLQQDGPTGELYPVEVNEVSVRGVISNRLSSKIASDPLKTNAAIENANLQTIDRAYLKDTCDTLVVKWTCRILPFTGEPDTCNNQEFQGVVEDLVEAFNGGKGIDDLSRRYAVNIATGRWLWRNRHGAENVRILVRYGEDGRIEFHDVQDVDMNDFDRPDKGIDELADMIKAGFLGRRFVNLHVTAWVKLGYGQEVYPSQELILDSVGTKRSKRKVLCVLDGKAAIHGQKIGNALRTIDTWYGEEGESAMPIPVETYGSVTRKGYAFRQPRQKKDFYTLFDGWTLQGIEPNEGDKKFVMAMLIRGGVFGAAGKEK